MILANKYLTKVLYSEYIKNSQNSIVRKQHNLKLGLSVSRQLTKKDTRMADTRLNRCSISLAVREMQVKTIMKYSYHSY